MKNETKARKAKKAKKANILFELMISYKPAHEVAVWGIALHLIGHSLIIHYLSMSLENRNVKGQSTPSIPQSFKLRTRHNTCNARYDSMRFESLIEFIVL